MQQQARKKIITLPGRCLISGAALVMLLLSSEVSEVSAKVSTEDVHNVSEICMDVQRLLKDYAQIGMNISGRGATVSRNEISENTVGVIIAVSIGYAALILGFSIEGSELAAILGFGILRGILRRRSIIENNIVNNGKDPAIAINGSTAMKLNHNKVVGRKDTPGILVVNGATVEEMIGNAVDIGDDTPRFMVDQGSVVKAKKR